jgi:hypothetical protein
MDEQEGNVDGKQHGHEDQQLPHVGKAISGPVDS